jgi:phospholipid/cholesterol/gamma-HCH transport system substrate-binding protein
MNLEEKYGGTIYRNATMLLRPKTGLKDMVVEVTPGDPRTGKLPEGGRVPVSNTQPDVNLDEILASLDADTRSFLNLLISNGADGLRGREKDLSRTIKQLEPTAQALRAINSKLKDRRTNIKRVVNRFSLVSEELGSSEDDLTSVVSSSNAVFSSIARQDASLRSALRELPVALRSTRTGLAKADTLAEQLGPTLDDLNPTARTLAPTLRAVRPFVRDATPIIRDEIRPFTRVAQPLVRDLRPAARDLSRLTPDLVASGKVLNNLLNAAAYNPPGEASEGYLFWISWANHLGANIFSTQDAHGPIRRGLLALNCASAGILDQVSQVNESLAALVGLLNAPGIEDAVCTQPGQEGAGGGG